jgi:lysylphosphatidylglycerol synthetase-like protein (DUF2156 family)
MPSLRILIDRFLDGRAPTIPQADLDEDTRLALAGQHGDFSLSYSTATQSRLAHFGDAHGYIAFRTKMGHHFALADPVADPAHHERYVRHFIEAGVYPTFVQIGEATARLLAGLGYQINQMGFDTKLSLPAHDFSGKLNQTVRYSERWLIKNGYVFVEEDSHEVHVDVIERLSDDWRAGRIVRRWEMTFLNRPFSAKLGTGMRRFLLLAPDGELVALLDFDPLSRDGKVIGYTTSFKRKRAHATSHAEIGLTKFAVDRFREEGISSVTLGLSPMAGIEPSGFAESDFWRTWFQRSYDSDLINRHRFNLRGQAAFKRRFHGTEEPTYLAFRKGSFMEMFALLRLLKVV